MAESDGDEQTTGAPSGTHDVFISYASANSAVAEAACAAMERTGMRCWIAPRDVTPGASYAGQIIHAIDTAKTVVLILSQNAVSSPHVLREVERAASKRHPIVPLRIDQEPLPADFEYFLNTSHWLNASGSDTAQAMPKLVSAVRLSIQALVVKPASTATTNAAATAVYAPRTNRNAIVVACVVGLAIAGIAVDRIWLTSRRTVSFPAPAVPISASMSSPAAPTIPEKSIAILPFVDMSERHDQEYFADGMADEVIDLLAKIPGVRVIGRTSSFQFKGKSEDLRTIGAKLGATYVMEGSVRRSGGRLRVTAQVIATEDGSHRWSEIYDADFGDVLKIQDRIAVGLVRALQVSVGADLPSRPMLKSAKGYDLYQRGRHALDRFDRVGFESAAGYFQQAHELDPTSVRAAESLAAAHTYLAEGSGGGGGGFVAVDEGFERARTSVERALALDPQSGVAHSILAYIHLVYDWDLPAALQEIQKALTFSPRDPLIIQDAADIHLAQGDLEEAERLYNEVLALDPLYAGLHWGLGTIAIRTGRLMQAEAEARRILEISPTYNGGHYFLGHILLAEGKQVAALAEMQKETVAGGLYAGVAIVNHAMKRHAESDAALAKATNSYAIEWPCGIAAVHAYRTEFDQAFVWLDRAYRQKDSTLAYFKVDPYFDILKTDPRYKAFLRKMNLPD